MFWFFQLTMQPRIVHLTVLAAIVGLAVAANVPSTPGRKLNIPAFNNAGKTKGLEIWRIENFQPVAVPKAEYGKFYSGDSYIVLNVSRFLVNVATLINLTFFFCRPSKTRTRKNLTMRTSGWV